jgi:hypothetical protein
LEGLGIAMGLCRKLFLAAIVVSVSGCLYTHGTRLPPVQKTIAFPPVNESVQADEGMILVANGNFYAYDGIELLNTINARLGVGGNPAMGISGAPPNVMLRPQYLFPQSEDEDYIYYTGNVRFYYGGAPIVDDPRTSASEWKVGGLRISKLDSNDIAIWAPRHERVYDPEFPAKNFRIGHPSEPALIRTAVIERSTRGAWAKELIYQGPADDGALYFTYQEHRGAAGRPVDRDDIKFDPVDGPVLTVKGAMIEIQGTHEDKIFYKVIENFPSPRQEPDFSPAKTVMTPE